MSTTQDIYTPTLSVKEGDSLPTLEDTLEDSDGNPIDLRDVDEVRVYVAHQASGDLIVNAEAEIVDARYGEVSYQFETYQTARRGRHIAEWVIYKDGDTQTVPPDTFVAIDIFEPIDRELDPSEFDDADISVTTLHTDSIRANSGDTITIHDVTQFEDNVLISDFEISDDGTQVSLDYAGNAITIDDSGISVPSGTDPDHIARLDDLGDGGGDVLNPMQEHLDANGYTIHTLPDPVGADEAATKGYVDTEVSSVDTSDSDLEHWGWIDASDYGYPGDRTGGDIATLVDDHPDKTIILPEGDYSLESEILYSSGSNRDRVAIIGKPNARIHVENGNVGELIRATDFPKLRLENLTLVIDETDDTIDAGWGRWNITERLVARNLTIEGQRFYQTDTAGDKFVMLVNMVNEDATGLVENCRVPDGFKERNDNDDTLGDGGIGFASEPEHVGTTIWKNCYIKNCWGNGYYIKDGEGRNIIIGCGAEDCGMAHIRIGWNDIIIGSWAKHDLDRTYYEDLGADVFDGTLLDIDEARGTSVMGFRAINKSSHNPTVRVRTGAGQCTLRDLWVDHDVDNGVMQLSQSDAADSDAQDNTHKVGVAKVQGARIFDSGTTSGRASSIRVNRTICKLENITCEATADSWRSNLQVRGGRVWVDGCHFTNAGGNEYCVELGRSTDTNTIDLASIRNSYLDGGFIFRDNTTVHAFDVVGNDLQDVAESNLFYDTVNPQNVCDDVNWMGNAGHLSTKFGTLHQFEMGTDTLTVETDLTLNGTLTSNPLRAEGNGYGNTTFENLSGLTGDFDGQVRKDDGTNTPARGTVCVWDDVNAVWRPMNDPDTGSFT